MPTYQYACTQCAHRLEAVQAFTDDPLVECPECAGRLRKVFSSVGVVFKGSGFYRTDSRSSSAPDGGTKSDTAAKTDSAPKSESSTSSGTGSATTSSSTPAAASAAA